MPSSIKYFKRDPNGKGRGPGVYYLRARGYYSKYSIARDKAKLSKGWKVHKVGIPKKTKIPQTSDGRLRR